jgi:hypothetical protein
MTKSRGANEMAEITIRELMANETPVGAACSPMILTKQGRREGPKDANCETCGYEWKGSFTLDWNTLEWQCSPCATMLDARGEVPAGIAGNDI